MQETFKKELIIKLLVTRKNKPRSIYQYSNEVPRLSGHNRYSFDPQFPKET